MNVCVFELPCNILSWYEYWIMRKPCGVVTTLRYQLRKKGPKDVLKEETCTAIC